MKIYTIIGGVNGCGKSSLTGALKAERTDLGCMIDVDKLTAQYGDHITAGRVAVEKIEDFLARGVSFTQETTLSGAKTEKTVRKAKDAGYYIRLYYIGLDTVEEAKKRIANRVSKGGHDIPSDDVERRFRSRFDALGRILPYCDEVTLFDNENGFVEVAEYRNGELIMKGEYRPRWISELADVLRDDD